MILRYQNRQFWRPLVSGGAIGYPSDGATEVRSVVKVTGPVLIHGFSLGSDGEVEEEGFLIGVALPGEDTHLRVSHGRGLRLVFTVPKGTEAWLYDDREDLQVVAPVGESYTRFEKLGQRAMDPLQVVLHRDMVRKRLERIVAQGQPKDTRLEELQAALAKANERLSRMEADREAERAVVEGLSSEN